MVGRVPSGATLDVPMYAPADPTGPIELVLHDPDWTTAHRVAEAIRSRWNSPAEAVQPALVRITAPEQYQTPQARASFIAELEAITIDPDAAARVIINERTGTIVAGEHVSIAPVAVAHGGITVQIQSTPVVSQPNPLSKNGETVEATENTVSVEEENAHIIYLPGTTTIQEVAESLNAIGATPRDIIAIFQALRQAGALRAELVIL